MSANYKIIVVVLGMHRSGTSAISRALQVMGVVLGDRLMPPNSAVNAKGFWEDVDLNALNIKMLNFLGSDWHHLTPIESSDVEKLLNNGYAQLATALLRQKIGDSPIFGFKDPRVTKLLPFWKVIFAQCHYDVRYVISLRHPLSVVKSLDKRDGLDTVQSYYLWLGHVIESLAGSSGNKRILVDYDFLLQSPEHELNRIAECLDLKIEPSELQSYNADFLDKELRHTVFNLDDLLADIDCPPLVLEIYTALLRVASDQTPFDELSLQKDVESWLREFKRIKALLMLSDRFATQIVSLNQALYERDGQITNLNQDLFERDKQITILNQDLSERDNQITRLNQVLTVRDMSIANLSNEMEQRGEWASRLDAELNETRALLNTVTQSNSWRLTLPLREIRRWFTSPTQQANIYTRQTLRQAKRIYQSLPLNHRTKSLHRKFIAKNFPKVLLGSGSHSTTIPMLCSPNSVVTISNPRHGSQKKIPGIIEAASINISISRTPLVSIIIPIYGKVDYTLRCLASISLNPPRAEFEIIIVNDCSPDNSAEVLADIKGIHLIHNDTNQGFIRSCNTGAKAAQGEFLYFLNNDTEVTSGWMDELLRTFHEFPGTGLAGSKLIYPDGRLQEAGGIIWQDGSAWNFGRLQDPLLPVYNYAREVDYCSGASIMVPKILFEELGGFDKNYLPAYCEDSDLALKIRDKGYRVIYQPMSAVIHYEGITSGTDTTQGAKAYQIANSKKLYNRWKDRLQHYQPNGIDVDSAKDRQANRRVLVIDHCTPTPNQDAGSVTVFNMLLLLRELNFQVTFIPEDNFLYMPEYTTALQRAGIEVLYAPYHTTVEQHLKTCGNRYDLALLFRPGVVERHLKSIRMLCPKAKVLFHTVDLHFLRMSREAELQADKAKQKAADEMKQRELEAIRTSDASIVHSTAEFELLRQELPNVKLFVFPLIMETPGTSTSFSERSDIAFVGGYEHAPNVDAVQYFVSEIMPLLRVHLPGVRFHAIGSKPPAEIKALASEDIIIAGFVKDLNPLLDKMRISVAPLRYGAGIKGKIGTAMAIGLPVVATPLAAEGMLLSDGENILIGDGTELFAQTLIRLYNNELLWSSLSESSIKFADAAWGAEAAWKIFASILAALGIESRRNDRPLTLYSSKAK